MINTSWYNDVKIITDKAYQYLSTHNVNTNTAVVFDIDDTLISSKNGKCIGYVVELFNYAKRISTPFIITNRIGNQYAIDYTNKQLYECGIHGYKDIYFQHPNTYNDPWKYKREAREHIHNTGYIVLMSIGDMPWDIGEYGGRGFIIP